MDTHPPSSLTIGIIGGSGLGALLEQSAGTVERHQIDTPFGATSDAILETNWAGVRVLLLSRHGEGHVFNPSQVPYRANIFAFKQLGCTHLIATGAVGSLREEFKPRELVIPTQIIDKTNRRDGTFFEKAAVHVEFAEPFDAALRQILLEAGKKGSGDRDRGLERKDAGVLTDPSPLSADPSSSPTLHNRGCYVCMEGPAFSTRAESLMLRLWGGDLIGMTAMPEAKLAREAEIAYALVALVTDYDCWRQPPASQVADGTKVDSLALLEEIIGNLNAASESAMQLIRRAIELMATQRDTLMESPAHEALKLGIWSEKSKIALAEIERLRPLWGRYFNEGVSG